MYKTLFPNDFVKNPKDKNRFKKYYSTLLKQNKMKTKTKEIKYISLFTGIGGFEVALHTIFPNAKCVGYSEIKQKALTIYEDQFPNHTNLGNIENLTKEYVQNLVKDAGGCDLIFGGFPCTNLSTLAAFKGVNQGLEGEKSKLFWNMCKLIEWVVELNPDLDILIENNTSMKNIYKTMISEKLSEIIPKEVKMNKVMGGDVWVQQRNRLYWSTLNYTDNSYNLKFSDILDPIGSFNLDDHLISDRFVAGGNGIWTNKSNKDCDSIRINKNEDGTHSMYHCKTFNGKTRWSMGMHNDSSDKDEGYKYKVGKSRLLAGTHFTYYAMVWDRRNCKEGNFNVRKYTVNELEKLFMFPVSWSENYKHYPIDVFCNTILVPVLMNFFINL